MSHLLQALAQHWQLRLLCALTLGPLLGVVCLVLFTKREDSASGVLRVKRRIPTLRRTLQPTVS